MKTFAIFLAFSASIAAHAATDQPVYGLFGQLAMTRPDDPNGQTALLFSDRDGWKPRQDGLARALADQGVLVVGIDTAHYFAKLESIKDACSYPAGHLEELAHWIARHEALKEYSTPMLIGDGSGAVFAYATAAQAPVGTFASVMTLGWDYAWRFPKPVCPGDAGAMTAAMGKTGFGLIPVAKMPLPWLPLPWLANTRNDSMIDRLLTPLHPLSLLLRPRQAAISADADLARHYAAQWQLSRHQAIRLPDDIADLPLTEIAPIGEDHNRIVLLMTGDGGWASLDQGVAAVMSKQGLRVIGFSTLKYFWTARDVEQSAAAVSRVLAYYGQKYPHARLVVAGYSFGASLVPAMINRLPPALLDRVDVGIMLSPDDEAVFEIKVGDWLGAGDHAGNLPVQPEIEKSSVPLVCFRGNDEEDSFCAGFKSPKFSAVSLPGGHHYDGDYDTLGRTMLSYMPK